MNRSRDPDTRAKKNIKREQNFSSRQESNRLAVTCSKWSPPGGAKKKSQKKSHCAKIPIKAMPLLRNLHKLATIKRQS